MNKAQALSAISKLWMEQPESDRTTLKFLDFYFEIEKKHPHLLTWSDSDEKMDLTIRAYLSQHNQLTYL